MPKLTRRLKTKGPIAEKIIHEIRKTSRGSVVDFEHWRLGKNDGEKVTTHEGESLSQFDSLHATYVSALRRVDGFICSLSNLDVTEKLLQRRAKTEDIYMPSYPPMSPVTDSYFSTWLCFDMCVGVKQETYGSLLIDCLKAFGSDPSLMNTLERFQQSRMGFYINEGYQDGFVMLRELYTNKTIKTRVITEFKGQPGEIWFVRLLPDPAQQLDYWIALTTPYVVINTQALRTQSPLYPEKEWLAFIERNLFKMKKKTAEKAYESFMKFGPSIHYWLEYVFLAYVNFNNEHILLTGFPDRPKTLPHGNLADMA